MKFDAFDGGEEHEGITRKPLNGFTSAKIKGFMPPGAFQSKSGGSLNILKDPTKLSDGASYGDGEVYIDVGRKLIHLHRYALNNGVASNIPINGGVELECLYNCLKREWAADRHGKGLSNIICPIISVSPSFYLLTDGWNIGNISTGLIRNAGWMALSRTDLASVTEKWAGIVTTGNVGASRHLYYCRNFNQQTTLTQSFDHYGHVNQSIKFWDRTGDSSQFFEIEDDLGKTLATLATAGLKELSCDINYFDVNAP